jgi:hypothetical protein
LQARSGWGMRPTTLRASLHTPAMSAIEPLGLSTPVGRTGVLAGAGGVSAQVVALEVVDRYAGTCPTSAPRARVSVSACTSTVRRERPRFFWAHGDRPHQRPGEVQMPTARAADRANSLTQPSPARTHVGSGQVVAGAGPARRDDGVDRTRRASPCESSASPPATDASRRRTRSWAGKRTTPTFVVVVGRHRVGGVIVASSMTGL